MATPGAISDALAAQISTELCGTANPLIPDLQVVAIGPYPFPSAPSIDIYPADPFQEAMAFGNANNEFYFLVRARVATPDDEAGKRLLLSMMDPQSATSVAQAILGDRTLGGVGATVASVIGPTGYGLYPDVGPDNTALVGCTWTVRIV